MARRCAPVFRVPPSWKQIRTIDMHTGGEPLRVLVELPEALEGRTVLDRRRYMRDNLDELRTCLMWEPRGHADMYGCVITEANDEGADFGAIFLTNDGYSTMCGHATIALARLAVELNWVPGQSVTIDAPCGRLEARVDSGESASFRGVPSFVVGLDRRVHIDGVGEIRYDLAYGGAYYAYVDARQLVDFREYRSIIDLGMRIKAAVAAIETIQHPVEPDLSFLYGVIFIGPSDHVHSRNVCVFANGEVDRSPTGSGLSGRVAIEHARGSIQAGDMITVESLTHSRFDATIAETTRYGGYDAVIPLISGSAYITGIHTFVVDPNDPFKSGFFLR